MVTRDVSTHSQCVEFHPAAREALSHEAQTRLPAHLERDALKLSMEMPAVVALRLAKIARRRAGLGAAETRLMVRAKIKAAARMFSALCGEEHLGR